MSDKKITSPLNVNIFSTSKAMTIKKNTKWEIMFDLLPNSHSPKAHYKDILN